jgi:hypothetical protein
MLRLAPGSSVTASIDRHGWHSALRIVTTSQIERRQQDFVVHLSTRVNHVVGSYRCYLISAVPTPPRRTVRNASFPMLGGAGKDGIWMNLNQPGGGIGTRRLLSSNAGHYIKMQCLG